jgi:predicted aconitase with swiveling domain
MEIILKGRPVVKGKTAGEAFVADKPVCFVGGIDVQSGDFIEHEHPFYGKNVAGKVLVYPTGKGSTGGSYVLYEATYNGVGPAAIINQRIEQVTAVGAILSEIPVIDQVEPDPVLTIRDGDYVELDATNGVIKVTRKE